MWRWFDFGHVTVRCAECDETRGLNDVLPSDVRPHRFQCKGGCA